MRRTGTRDESDKIDVFAAGSAAMSVAEPFLRLAFDFLFEDLYDHAGLARVDRTFAAWLAEADAALHAGWSAARANPDTLATKAEAELLIAVAPHFDRFVAKLFAIEDEWESLFEDHHRLAPLFRVKRKFVQRRAML